jgi:hypothetical protein
MTWDTAGVGRGGMAIVIKIWKFQKTDKTKISENRQNFAMNFFSLLTFTTNGTKRTTLCEGRWSDDADGGRTVRLDSEEFPSFWLSGMAGPGCADFVVTGGRIDASWGDESIPHTQFMTRLCPAGIEVYCDGFSVLIPPPAPTGIANDIDTPAGQSSKRGLFIDSRGGCTAIRLSRDVDVWALMDLVFLDAHVPGFGMKNMQAIRSGDRMFELWFDDSGTFYGQRNNTVESITGLEFHGGVGAFIFERSTDYYQSSGMDYDDYHDILTGYTGDEHSDTELVRFAISRIRQCEQ